jgi:hypothetical protein
MILHILLHALFVLPHQQGCRGDYKNLPGPDINLLKVLLFFSPLLDSREGTGVSLILQT